MKTVLAGVDEATFDFRLTMDDSNKISALRDAILPEATNSPKNQRCALMVKDTSHEKKGANSLELLFQASDLSALRASLNTNLRLISSVLRTLEASPPRSETLKKST